MQPDSIYIQRNSAPFISLEAPLHTQWTTLPLLWLETLFPKLEIRTPESDEHIDEICWLWKGAKTPKGYNGEKRQKPLIKVPVELKSRSFNNVLVDKRICEFYYIFDPSLHQRTIYVDRICGEDLCLNPRHLIPRTSVNNYATKKNRMSDMGRKKKTRTAEQKFAHRVYMRSYMHRRRGMMK